MSLQGQLAQLGILPELGGSGIQFDGCIVANGGLALSVGGSLFVDGSVTASGNGESWGTAKKTVQEAIDAATANMVIYIAPGEYAEEVTIDVANLTLIGVGNRGSVYIATDTTNGTAVLVTADDVTLINVGCDGDGTGFGLHLQGDVDRFRAFSCKIEDGAAAAKLESTATGAVSDTRFVDCEFAWSAIGINITVSGGGDPVTQTLVKDCLFQNITADCILADGTFTADLWVAGNIFSAQEDGTEPTNYIDAAIASTTGFICDNYFATTLLDTGSFSIAAGVLVAGNYTQAESGGGGASGTAGRPDA